MSDAAKTTMPTTEELNNALTQVNKKLRLGLWFTHISFGVFLLLMSWLNFQPADSSVKLWLVKIFPLLIFVPGFVKRKYRTYSWLCFGILPYFIWMTPLVMGRGAWSDWVMVILIVVLFISSMMTSRWMQQQSYLGWQISHTPSN
ncbi:hypothetical protein GCM10011613_07030 [Cellvibrio zantedeschiae]|uniref:DUF2069 domain-containing protein n=1 Tax=Cellvibrio zantedeschiae TaxID=1237077 RepID=A0ABQ3AT13_9GAMM|nr:DUF2069 domain-containing protein [Cellvibrio zantedeschiae]GGY65745.1 hypothetical protein GCM10011613_07030 [Cellvibrio zantedeschiae]